jgi:hypothetical protein
MSVAITSLRFGLGLVFALLLVSTGPLCAQDAVGEGIPGAFQELFTLLQVQLKAIAGAIPAPSQQKLEKMTIVGEVSSADCLLGQNLLTQLALKTAVMELEQLKKIGVDAVVMSIRYPMLCRDAHRDEKELAAFMQFYRYLAEETRKRRMKLMISYGCLPGSAVFSEKPVRRFYKQLAYERFKHERWAVLGAIIQELKPDMVTLGSDYEQMQSVTGFPLNEPAARIEAVKTCLADLATLKLRQTCRLGAGCLVTNPDYLALTNALAAETTIDFIDIGIPAINKGYWRRAVEIADALKASPKAVAISEARLTKMADGELEKIHSPEVSARQVFSFWRRLDQQFAEAMIRLACWKDFSFVTVSHGGRLFAYLPFSPEAAQSSPEQVTSEAITVAGEAIVKERLSETGKALAQFLIGVRKSASPD